MDYYENGVSEIFEPVSAFRKEGVRGQIFLIIGFYSSFIGFGGN